jgi:NRPS condensation-like uncharacterized protein/acyl carrier protein
VKINKLSSNVVNVGNFSKAAPATESQRELWATMSMSPEASLCYNEVLNLSLHGNLSVEILKESLQVVLSNHDILRSVFSENGKSFLIQESVAIELPLIDLSGVESGLEKFNQIKEQEVKTPFDLFHGPCIRFVLVKISHQKYSLLVSAHHIVCDGWSVAVLLTELGKTYSARLANNVPPGPAENQFADYAVEELRFGLNNTHKSFWINQFTPPLCSNSFPTDFSRPAFRSYDSQFIKIEIPKDLVLKIKKLGVSQGSSLYTVLMANFMILLRRISRSQDIVVGVASAAQSGLGRHDLVGHLVNLLPLRAKIDEDLEFSKFLRSLRTSMLDAFENQFFSYGTLLKELNIARNPSEIPLLNCVFNIDQQSPGQGLNFKDLKAAYEVVPREYENFELFVNAVSCEDNLSIECQYNSALFKRSTVENWLSSYLELLVASADAPHAKIKTMILDELIVPGPQVTTKIANSYNIPRDPEVERTLCRLWGKVLGLDIVKPEDNFFVLGGHSLLAVELASLLQFEFKKEISIREIFENPTILEFSAIVTGLAQTTVSEIPLVPRPDISTGPVSMNQLQVWYVEELFTDTKMHNLSTSLRIKWKVNPDILERAVHYFLKRHDALRTAIEVDNGTPFQRIFDHHDPIFRPELEVVQCEENIVLDLMRAETSKLFDKTKPPMFRAKLYQLGPNDYYFFFMVHHAVWDGWCFDIFFEELDVIYTALENGVEPNFKRNPNLRYLDHTIWMQKSLDAGVFDGQLDYWKNKLAAPLPILEVPTDYPRPKTASHDGGNFRFALNLQQIKRIKDYAAARNTTVFNVMLTAYKMTLSHVAGLQDIIVGSPIRGRNNPELLQTIGYFVNTLALRTSIDLNQSFDENLKRVTTTCLEGFSNQDVPFELLLRNLQYVRDMGRTAVYQTFFTFQDMTNRQFYINERPV